MRDESRFDAERFLASVTTRPGVYKMVGRDGEVLYVGKAGNLRARLQSYFRPGASEKQKRIVAALGHIEVTVTATEAEALLLESRWIKQLQPRYNVALKDDKRYPYLRLTLNHPFPRLDLFRGTPRKGERCFGPYPSVGTVRALLDQLAPLFQLRSCSDALFRNRSRPCLEHQLGRCSAPCVGKISEKAYREQVERLIALFEGQGEALVERLASEMGEAAKALQFERAARIRDQIAALRELLALSGQKGERKATDVVVQLPHAGGLYFYVAQFRNGIYTAGYGFLWPEAGEEAIESFLGQYYLARPKPERLLLSPPPERPGLIEEMLEVRVAVRPRGALAAWCEMARLNAEEALRHLLAGHERHARRWERLKEALALPRLERIEGFDISHLQGRGTVASCVVFGPEGPQREQFRRYTLSKAPPGDDPAALKEVVSRRLKRLLQEGISLPDLLVIDGGKGQVAAVEAVLSELGLSLPIVGIAKGERRHFRLDRFSLGGQPLEVERLGEAALLLQQVRDEAHRFALKGQRRKRQKRSLLEAIPGVGPKRRKLLLERFGGIRGLRRASPRELAQVEGIGPKLAVQIYAALHGEAPPAILPGELEA